MSQERLIERLVLCLEQPGCSVDDVNAALKDLFGNTASPWKPKSKKA